MIDAAPNNFPDAPFYLICDQCNAKWFASTARMRCPRCDVWTLSGERQTPPWRRPPIRTESTKLRTT